MVTRRQIYEHYLKSAESALKDRIKTLSEKKQLSEKQCKRDATYRKFEAVVRKFKRRLKALDGVDAVNADLEKRRAERLAVPKEERKKAKLAAKPKEDKKPKGKGGGKKAAATPPA